MRKLLLSTFLVVMAHGYLLATPAQAHIELIEPPARYDINVNPIANKACPCGVSVNNDPNNNRTCAVDGDRNDPKRSNNVTTLLMGSTLKVRFKEYVAHSGRYRIAIDMDGADLADFNSNILLDEMDPPTDTGNTGNGNNWEFEVTLPNQACDNCTLQLIQVMDGMMDTPVPDPVGRSSYYTCADIKLVEELGTEPDAGTGGGGNGGGGGGNGGGGNGTATGGCQIGGSQAPSTSFLLGLALFVFLGHRRRFDIR